MGRAQLIKYTGYDGYWVIFCRDVYIDYKISRGANLASIFSQCSRSYLTCRYRHFNVVCYKDGLDCFHSLLKVHVCLF